jgi:FAD/FMN-containing dehydrogenase
MNDFRGPIHLPGDDAYETERHTWSRRIDPRPAIVAEALSASDVRTAVLAAIERGMPFAVQSTGHGTHVPADGGLLLKTGRMAEVLVDPARRVARVGPGARWEEVIAAAAPFGLAPVSGTSTSVGVAGYTLGGGFGWLSRKHGLAADNLLRADVVTADGRLVSASARHNADLFWALRGGGPNFGVVTALEFRLHSLASAYAGVARFERERAYELLERYRDYARWMPDELNVSVVVTEDSVSVRGLYAGDAGRGRRALAPLFEVAGPPVEDTFAVIGYAGSGSIGGTAPRQFELFDALTDDVIDAVVETPLNAAEVRVWGGAIARCADPGAAAHRGVPFSITVDGHSDELAAYATGGSFLNFLGDPSQTERAFTAANWARLREIKRAYDPHNVFGLGHNVPPSVGVALAA